MKRFLVSVFIVAGIMGVTALATPTNSVYAADRACDRKFLTFPAWYNGLASKSGTSCVIDAPKQDKDGTLIRRFAAKILLNIVDILMQLVAYASIVYLIIGGFKYLTSAGLPDKMAAAKKTIFNAIIGLIIAILAVAIVSLVGASV